MDISRFSSWYDVRKEATALFNLKNMPSVFTKQKLAEGYCSRTVKRSRVCDMGEFFIVAQANDARRIEAAGFKLI